MDNDDWKWTSIGDAVGTLLAGLGRPLASGKVLSFEAAFARRNRDHATSGVVESGEIFSFENCVKTRCGTRTGQAS